MDLRHAVSLAILGLVAPMAGAVDWPGTTPCNATLQQCLDAVPAGSTVNVKTSAIVPVADFANLFLSKPLSLQAAPGYRPRIPAGHSISGSYTATAGTNWTMSVSGFTLLEGAIALESGGGNATLAVTGMDITTIDQASTSIGSGVGMRNNGSGTLNFTVANNMVRIDVSDVSQPPGVYVDDNGNGNLIGVVHDNRFLNLGAQSMRGVTLSPSGTSSVRVYANQFSGEMTSGISAFPTNGNVALTLDVVSNAIVCEHTTSGFGIDVVAPSAGTFAAQVFNNTVVGCLEGFGIGNTGNVSGRVSGNVFAKNNFGLMIGSYAASVSNDHNLVYANTTNNFVAGSGTLTSDPLLDTKPLSGRLGTGSPAIDAADSTALRNLLTADAIGEIDADGLRRFKGASSLADIGAFEFGDSAIAQRVTNAASSASEIDNIALNGVATARPQSIETRTLDSYQTLSNPRFIGMDYVGNRYRVRNEGGNLFALNSGYNVFAPAQGAGVFLHTSAASNVSGFGTQINNAYLNGKADRIVLVTHRPGTAFNHSFGTGFFFGSWFVFQSDAQTGDPDFPAGLDFHVYAQDPSLDAFHWYGSEGGTTSYTVVDQPLINGDPCARIYAQTGIGSFDAHPVGLRYVSALKRWRIENQDGATLPAGTDFYVVVDEAATAACRYEHLFHDGVEVLD